MANIIKLKQSSVAGKIPNVGDLVQGELAVNTADEKLYLKNSSGVIVEVGAGGGGGGGYTSSTTAPVNPTDGDHWFDPDSATIYIRVSSIWLDITAAGTVAAGTLMGVNSLSDVSSASAARANLGLVIGTNVHPYDGTIIVGADIGSTVQAYDATIVVDADIGVTVQAYDATIVVDADIGVTVAGQATTYTKLEVDAAVAGIVDSAPATLDTLKELAAALGDDANFATTVTNSIAGKEAADATILKDADIGSTVQAYDATLQSRLDDIEAIALAGL